jgi:hypothetical protein
MSADRYCGPNGTVQTEQRRVRSDRIHPELLTVIGSTSAPEAGQNKPLGTRTQSGGVGNQRDLDELREPVNLKE